MKSLMRSVSDGVPENSILPITISRGKNILSGVMTVAEVIFSYGCTVTSRSHGIFPYTLANSG